ncbi:RNA polymerase sigma factor SigJ [Streptomyces sp. TLI_171]|uniref:RNA polymerase sigma factor SigJ n=1 Tax=Streptomyces sp. TLI_171 TaxID=1938859 RepID=UPI000C3DDA88|nr:RNA polymerase sigma factor SigJ [Streptomyces sp. TLI_171]RKE22443.1 RNA polymerase sigma-70 factor (ECF subfamily) [Streptomyces sp. TLI_171]
MEDTVDERRAGALRAVADERRQLTNLAYRLLGSLADAEDVVQEAYARWYAMPPEQRAAVDSPGGWLTTVAGRICLDLLGSARVRRERYVGAWLPEPVPEQHGGAAGDPADRITLDESVSMAFLMVLESMTPAERVAFVLHDVFQYPFAEVAEVVGRSAAACRQLATSARRRIRDARPPDGPVGAQAGVVREFARAWAAKDVRSLMALLDPDAVVVADGGGLVGALLEPLSGSERIVRTWVELAAAAPAMTFLERTVNGRPGLIARHDGTTVTVYSFRIADGRITHIWGVRNPEKLRPWTALDGDGV